jgi:hypothetical protein
MKGADYRQRATEGEFQDAVIALAKLKGWKVAHFRPALTSKGWRTPMQGDKGFPDLVLARKGEVKFAELKVRSNRITADQADWGIHIGDTWHVWRPGDMDLIRKVLE